MFVHRSNSLEELVDRLSAITHVPLENLLTQEIILIQSAGMERYLSRELARRRGIAANVSFPFPRAFFRDVLERTLGPDDAAAGFEREAMAWSIFGLLGDLHSFESDPQVRLVQGHLANDPDGIQRLLLSEQLAHLFDQYVMFRPRMVLLWEKGEEPTNFQAQLWRKLVERYGTGHFAGRCAAFLRGVDDSVIRRVLPKRISVMGGPGLPPLFLQILARLGQAIDVHLFSFSVCQEYFADAHPLDDPLPEVGEGLHPLLLSLGKVGADYQHLIELVGHYEDGTARFVPPASDSLLCLLQRGLIEGKLLRATRQDVLQDGSITIDSCHSRLREVEILHDRLLNWFAEDATLRAEDVVVLAPAIEEYSPLVSAVFAARSGHEPAIAHRIADRSERVTNPAARALLLGLALLRGRFKVSHMLDLLQLEPVRARYRVDPSGLERLQEWIRQAGIRWGIDAAHRGEFGLPHDDLNTWRFGLRRLLLGYSLFDDETQLFQNSVPVDDVSLGDAELLGQFVQFCETLFGFWSRLERAGDVGLSLRHWEIFLTDLLDALVAESPEGAWDREGVRRTLVEIRAAREPELQSSEQVAQDSGAASGAGDAGLLGLSAVEHLVATALESSRPSTDFLAGGVTFCALLPLRTIPFRRVCVLGLNQGDFPRSDLHHELDSMRDSPKRGDRSLRADDRYLFLEVLLAARERLSLSYVGRSVQDNTEKPPSVILDELQTTLGRIAGAETGVAVVEHPLQPFHPSYFGDDSRNDSTPPKSVRQGRSFDARCFEGAKSLLAPRQDVTPFFTGRCEEEADGWAELDAFVDVSLDELIRFWKDPSAALLATLGVYLDDELEQLEDREPIVETALERYLVGEGLLRSLARNEDLHQDVLLRRGSLPVGQGGQLLIRSVSEVAAEIAQRSSAYRQAELREPLSMELSVSEALEARVFEALEAEKELKYPTSLRSPILLRGSIDQVYGTTRLETSYGQATVGRLLALWINHLAACSLEMGLTKSVLLARAPAGSDSPTIEVALAAVPASAARTHLTELAQLCELGKKVPLRFFPAASHGYYEAMTRPPARLSEDMVLERAMERARGAFVPLRGVVTRTSALDELYRGRDPLGQDQNDPEEFSESSFALLAECVFGPLFRATEDDEKAPAGLRVIRGGRP